ncbi:MAG: AGE family epimerase/isomerase [Bacteroidota bacterium]
MDSDETIILKEYLEKTEKYLNEKLIPFWTQRAVEPKFGGFQTNYDRDGNRTEVTEKSFLSQVRSVFTISHAMRLGFDWPNGEAAIQQGIEFLQKYFFDKEYDGYYWIVSEDGKPIDDNKIIYGHSFLIYGLSEYALLTGDKSAKDEAIRIFDLLQTKVADRENDGYHEHFDRYFNLKKARDDMSSHKSLDVHMHLMEAFTTLYELTQKEEHRKALTDVIDLIFEKMIEPNTGTGISMFTNDWIPIANVELDTVWGRDRFDEDGKSTDITSYGHNIEFAWLYLHSQDILEIPREKSLDKVIPIYEHTYKNGIDWKHGGIFVEGERYGSPTERTKEFWQQAEAMVGFLDAYILTKEKRYLDAYINVYDFVFSKVINWDQGEWFALNEENGDLIWDYMGTSWKVFYHTVRGTCQIVNKMKKTLNS